MKQPDGYWVVNAGRLLVKDISGIHIPGEILADDFGLTNGLANGRSGDPWGARLAKGWVKVERSHLSAARNKCDLGFLEEVVIVFIHFCKKRY